MTKGSTVSTLRTVKRPCFNCFSEERRENIVRSYQLTPIAHLKLLSGNEIMSCTGTRVTDHYYVFEYRLRDEHQQDEGTFHCGIVAAEHFLQLADLKPLPLFNPLASDSFLTSNHGNDKNDYAARNPVATELSNAIHLLFICWRMVPSGSFAKYLSDIRKSPSVQPPENRIHHLNNVLAKRNFVLQDGIQRLRVKNAIRNFSFDNLTNIVEARNKKSFFG